jgi:hypothetical protein
VASGGAIATAADAAGSSVCAVFLSWASSLSASDGRGTVDRVGRGEERALLDSPALLGSLGRLPTSTAAATFAPSCFKGTAVSSHSSE